MGTRVTTDLPSIPGTNNIVCPYGADIDTRTTGTVQYVPFTSDNLEMYIVSGFIEGQTRHNFEPTSMMVAEWKNVPQDGGSLVRLLSYKY